MATLQIIFSIMHYTSWPAYNWLVRTKMYKVNENSNHDVQWNMTFE